MMSSLRKFLNQDISIDRGLLAAILFLLGLGLVQVYSSSFIFAIESFDNGLFFVKKQALFVLLGLVVLLIVSYLPWAILKKLTVALWFIALVGLVLTLVPGLGVKVGGATRWLSLGAGFRIEPSEILKYTFPALLALFIPAQIGRGKNVFSMHANKIKIALLVLIAGAFAILLKQPDFGSMAILAVVGFGILFSRGLNWLYVFASIGAMGSAFYMLVVSQPYRMARVAAFLDPWSDPAKKGFQVIQSMLGFHSGGLTGVGLGQGQGKLFFLPEAHTDFTLAVLGEELGFIGVAGVLLIFGFVAFRGLQISTIAKTEREKVIALGVTLIFSLTAFINAGVAMGLLPTKGLGMPFLSYGGSALLSTCFGLGLLLNIDRRARVESARSFIKIHH